MARSKPEEAAKTNDQKDQMKENTGVEGSGRQHLPMRFDVRIHSIRPEGTVKAMASLNINDAFAVKGLKVVSGSKGLFVAMPSYKSGNEYKDICFPVTAECQRQLQEAVIDAYGQAVAQGQDSVQKHQEMKQQPSGSAPESRVMEMAGM